MTDTDPIGTAALANRAAELGTDLALEREAHRQTRLDLIRLRHRIARGLCPQCDYDVKLLATHIARAHPTFDSDLL